MACFLVPTAEAIVASAVRHRTEAADGGATEASAPTVDGRVSWSRKLSWLTTMLWGGALLLALEHVWHGEVVFYPPFLTAMGSPADTAEMLREMATVGVGMAVLVTAIWAVMVIAVDHLPAVRSAFVGSEA